MNSNSKQCWHHYLPSFQLVFRRWLALWLPLLYLWSSLFLSIQTQLLAQLLPFLVFLLSGTVLKSIYYINYIPQVHEINSKTAFKSAFNPGQSIYPFRLWDFITFNIFIIKMCQFSDGCFIYIYFIGDYFGDVTLAITSSNCYFTSHCAFPIKIIVIQRQISGQKGLPKIFHARNIFDTIENFKKFQKFFFLNFIENSI